MKKIYNLDNRSLRPKVSIVIPIHDMEGGATFLWNSINALTEQTFRDFEIIITKDGDMPTNTNKGIAKARGEFVKILYLDDSLAHSEALQMMVDTLEQSGKEWLICGTDNNPDPYITPDIETGNNKLGSPSALMVKNRSSLFFDEHLTWLLDCDYYKRMINRCGEPVILHGVHVNIGVGDHQMTHQIPDERKQLEANYLSEKHA